LLAVIAWTILHCQLAQPLAVAQVTNGEQSILEKLGEDGMLFLEDAGSYFTAPLRFSGSDWFLTAGVAGGTMGLMAIDEDMKELLGSENQQTLNDDFWDIPTSYGIVAYANAFSLVLYTGGLASGSDDLRRTGRLLFESLSYSGITVMALRYTFGRSRPYPGNSPWDFNWFETSNEIQSFPSGHTTVAFAMSTVLAEEIGGIWARIAFYGMATMTGYARVRNNQHWFSDVVAGAGLGLLSGFHVINREREREGLADQARLTVVPLVNGIGLVYRLP
jgi:hypothetical protein